MNEVDIEAEKKEEARKSEEYSRLIQEQEKHISVVQSMQKSEHHIGSFAAGVAKE